MIYLLGDMHGGVDAKGFYKYIQTASPNDLLIILGDVSLNFDKTEENRIFTEYFLSQKHRIAIVDGNHENHPYLRSFPEDVEFGAPVHRLTENIVYLKRGYIYHIEGKSFFVMGGCMSSKKWHDAGLVYKNEEPSEEEIEFGMKTLAENGNRVDYVLTHKYRIEQDDSPSQYTLPKFTKYIDESVEFKHWYAGHFHKNERLDDRHSIVFDKPVELP